jgi:hypothetical protein
VGCGEKNILKTCGTRLQGVISLSQPLMIKASTIKNHRYYRALAKRFTKDRPVNAFIPSKLRYQTYLLDGLGLHRPQCFLDLSHNRLPHLLRIGKSLPSTLRVYQLPRFDDRHLEVPRDAPIHPFVHPYPMAEFLIEEILQCPRMAPVPSSATLLDHDVQHLGMRRAVMVVRRGKFNKRK